MISFMIEEPVKDLQDPLQLILSALAQRSLALTAFPGARYLLLNAVAFPLTGSLQSSMAIRPEQLPLVRL